LIAGYPIFLFLPGLCFLASGIWFRRRSASLDDGTDLGRRMAEATRTSSTVSIIFGVTMALIAIPLAITWHQVLH
jgi:hypothetical protein